MNTEKQGSPPNTRLPRQSIDRLARPFVRFLHIESAGGTVLLVFTVAAMVLSNSPWAAAFEHFWETSIGLHIGPLELTRSLREWINDGLMTLFFFLVALELKRELILGELNKPRTAALSIAAALGGMGVPAAIFLALQSGQSGAHGWGIVMATDTAFVIGCLALLGSRIPQSLRVFMLSVAIVDDVGAILVVAIGYSSDIAWWPLALAGLGVGVIRAMAKLGFRGFTLYILIGVLIWFAVDASGIHATITGVMLGLMTPARRWVSDERLYAILSQVIAHPATRESSGATSDRHTLQMAETAARETLSPVERLEIVLHPWVGFVIMPLFAFANAGLPLTLKDIDGLLAVAIFSGFVFGKPVGILLFSWLAIRLHIATRPPELTWKLLVGGGFLAGIGFTMALFIANMAFGESLIDSAKLGIFLASIFSAVAGLVILRFLPAREGTPAGAQE
ncbi:Na+/H+ antiporter NhaA [Microbulbifer yueqingensis]|uniref:Na(+)/H(+) antiporter NhaA n=1 Tax=Microbulbifer yueqingensis TaxID=658219 RepID=A0A1G8V3H7_9GAMM|nr:Na+/H+ antiporter NhaA [Microbulbifer yueqingensis]SDJ60417.1 sodium/proton antiporter, NhaA family [Microbulbifer yueqingensis]